MYKDKDRQKEANRKASQRQRDKKGMTDDCAKAGIVIPDHPVPVIPERTAQGNIRVSKPGDADYVPQCETTRAVVEPPGTPTLEELLTDNTTARRGNDIKVFKDLPPDVQVTIRRVSKSNEEFKKRTQIAIKYQHYIPSDGSYKGFIDTLYDPERINGRDGLKKGLTPQGGG